MDLKENPSDWVEVQAFVAALDRDIPKCKALLKRVDLADYLPVIEDAALLLSACAQEEMQRRATLS